MYKHKYDCPCLYTEGKSALRYTVAWLWLIPPHLDHGRWVWCLASGWWSTWVDCSTLHYKWYIWWWCQWRVCLYTHQCVRAACACYMYAFMSSPDHSLWPGELPGEACGVYLSLPEHHGLWRRQHPLPEGGVWRVSLPKSPAVIRCNCQHIYILKIEQHL